VSLPLAAQLCGAAADQSLPTAEPGRANRYGRMLKFQTTITPSEATRGYVLQGSLLGGAVICRQIRSSNVMPHVPAMCLELYGARPVEGWKRMCGAIHAFWRPPTPSA
jgi:heme oxygenase